MLGRLEAAADDENFGGDVTRRRRLGGLDLCEKLVEDPQQAVVVFASELRFVSNSILRGWMLKLTILVTKVPPSTKNSVASFILWSTSSASAHY